MGALLWLRLRLGARGRRSAVAERGADVEAGVPITEKNVCDAENLRSGGPMMAVNMPGASPPPNVSTGCAVHPSVTAATGRSGTTAASADVGD